jgi:ribosome-associated protein
LNQIKSAVSPTSDPDNSGHNKNKKSLINNKPGPSSARPEGEVLIETALEHVLELKALDAVVYNVRDTSSIADYLIVASGTSARHVKGIADNVKEKLSRSNISPQRIEGYQDGEWIVMDYADIIIHLFFEPKRQYFRFDELFGEEKKMPLKDSLNRQVRAFRTGMHPLV